MTTMKRNNSYDAIDFVSAISIAIFNTVVEKINSGENQAAVAQFLGEKIIQAWFNGASEPKVFKKLAKQLEADTDSPVDMRAGIDSIIEAIGLCTE